jgi:hypothetical protein
MGINVTTSKQQITASVAEDKISATVAGGFGATGPSGVITVTAPITNAGTTTAANVGLSVGSGLSVSGGSLVVTPDTYATLVGGKIPAEQLPSYVDDVLEFANVASLPVTGESGKIYVALNTGKIYRWSGSTYFEISTQPGNTDAVPEGASNLYFTNARARNAFGTGTDGQVITWSGGQWTAGNSYTLPTATASVLGGVKIGAGISIDGSGVISASSAYTLPTATNSVLGGVKIGSGVTITDGVISVSTNYAAASHAHAWSDITSGVPSALAGGYFAVDNDDYLCLRSLDQSKAIKVETNAGGYGGLSLYAIEFTNGEASLGEQTTPWLGTVDWDDVDNKPTLFDGAYSSLTGTPSTFTPSAHNQAWSTITSTPTSLSGYGITDGVTTSDSRLTDARTPTSHSHGNITNAGAIGSTSGQIVVTTTSGVLTTAATIAASTQVSGLSAIATSGSASDLGSGTVATARLGSGSASSSTFLRGDGTWATAGSTNASDLTSGTLAYARMADPTVTSPSQITASQNDYASFARGINRFSTNGAYNLTGMAAGSDGEVRVLTNTGATAANTLTIKDESASSSAANRFSVPWNGDCVIPAEGSVVVFYDGTSSRWRVV